MIVRIPRGVGASEFCKEGLHIIEHKGHCWWEGICPKESSISKCCGEDRLYIRDLNFSGTVLKGKEKADRMGTQRQ